MENSSEKEKVCLEENEQIGNQTLNIQIAKYKSLHDILDSPKKVGCAVFAMLFLTIAIFVGLGVITITLKRMYPYSNIRTNALGATTMQNENKEITYWLFNTSELWANSGIRVKAGDVLTIRASGKSHTSIHHLVENAAQNSMLKDLWMGASGYEHKDSLRDNLRSKYRIFSNKNHDALIMQVVPEGIDMSDGVLNKRFLTFDTPEIDTNNEVDGLPCREWLIRHRENFYYIGNEKINFRINNDGVLHFAVNDIVLTDTIITQMQNENNDSIDKYKPKKWEILNKKFFSFGPCPPENKAARDKPAKKEVSKEPTKECNEMTYYKKHKYYKAWFEDNVGSFLIIVERNKK